MHVLYTHAYTIILNWRIINLSSLFYKIINFKIDIIFLYKINISTYRNILKKL